MSAMIRYEILMAWRRRSLPLLWLLLLVGVIFFALIMRNVNQETGVMDDIGQAVTNADAPKWAQGVDPLVASHTISLGNLMIAAMVFYTVGVVLLMAEIIPLDRQFKMRELLDTLPISRATYLGGKLLSAWSGLLIGVGAVGIVSAIVVYLIFGVYDVRVFVALWIALLIPQSLVAATLTVLAASFVGSRRAAVLMGLVVMPFVLTLAFMGVPAFGGAGAMVEPIYALSVLLLPGAEANAVIVERITNALLLFGGIIAATWVFVWAWQQARAA